MGGKLLNYSIKKIVNKMTNGVLLIKSDKDENDQQIDKYRFVD